MNYALVLASGNSGSGCQKIRPLNKKQLEQPDLKNKNPIFNSKETSKRDSNKKNLQILMSKMKIDEDKIQPMDDNR